MKSKIVFERKMKIENEKVKSLFVHVFLICPITHHPSLLRLLPLLSGTAPLDKISLLTPPQRRTRAWSSDTPPEYVNH